MKTLSRRDVLRVGASAAAFPLAGSLSPAFAADKLTIGFISPITGPLGGFGQTDGFVLAAARKALANGLTIGGKAYAVEILTGTHNLIHPAPDNWPKI